mmetsp:Transcript_12700/g.42981  ORF Transcript_12700/g.42981 Transcript_12700/m.42981 type:complete len:147 (-) Transcript_12700:663-1103(-)
MVRIVDGEIVPDDDPRAIASARRQTQGSTTTQVPGGPAGANVQGVHSAPRAGAGAQGPEGMQAQSPLDAVAKFLSIEHVKVTIPGVPMVQLPTKQVPAVNCLVAAVLLFMFPTPRVALLLIGLYVLTNREQGQPRGAAPAQGQRPR